VKALLTGGADIHATAMDEMSSLHFAAQQGHTEVCRVLLNAGVTQILIM
jgi:ankyrin repeat protein